MDEANAAYQRLVDFFASEPEGYTEVADALVVIRGALDRMADGDEGAEAEAEAEGDPGED